jgi:hypothetical protein
LSSRPYVGGDGLGEITFAGEISISLCGGSYRWVIPLAALYNLFRLGLAYQAGHVITKHAGDIGVVTSDRSVPSFFDFGTSRI